MDDELDLTTPLSPEQLRQVMEWYSNPNMLTCQRDECFMAVFATAEAVQKENTYLRAMAQKAGCPYNNLNENGSCKSGYPGCACADDLNVFNDQHWEIMKQHHWQLRAQLAMVREAGSRVLKQEDCPMCDSGRLRNPDKGHWPECAYLAFEKALNATTETVTKWEAGKRVAVIRECLCLVESLQKQPAFDASGNYIMPSKLVEGLKALLPKEQEGR